MKDIKLAVILEENKKVRKSIKFIYATVETDVGGCQRLLPAGRKLRPREDGTNVYDGLTTDFGIF